MMQTTTQHGNPCMLNPLDNGRVEVRYPSDNQRGYVSMTCRRDFVLEKLKEAQEAMRFWGEVLEAMNGAKK